MYRLNKKGETIIEVVLAMTLLTAILFTAWGLVNKSSQISLAARKRTVMVNQIKEQAEILKSLYTSDRSSVVNLYFGGSTVVQSTNPPTPQSNPCDDTRGGSGVINGAVPQSSFYFNSSAKPVSGMKQQTPGSNADLTWIQVQQRTGYMDVYIRSCWTAIGLQAEENSHIIVRLNT